MSEGKSQSDTVGFLKLPSCLRCLAAQARERAASSHSGTSQASSSLAFRRQRSPEPAAKRKGDLKRRLQPRLWYVLLLVFVANVVSMACMMSVFWYDRSATVVEKFLKSSNATWEECIENISGKLHDQASWLEETIVDKTLVEPTRVVELNANMLSTMEPAMDALLNYTFLQLTRHFLDIEGISYMFPTGRFVEYERNSHHPGIRWRRGKYTFEYTPGDDFNNTSGCEVMCPPTAILIPGYTHQFSVDPETGKHAELLKNYSWSPLSGNSYGRAVEARGATIWTDAYIMNSGRSIALRAAKALFKDGQVAAVAGADLTLDNLSGVLSEIDLARTGRIYIIDRTERMIASSGGLDQVIGVDDNGDPLVRHDLPTSPSVRLPKQKFWNMTGDPLILACTEFLIQKRHILSRSLDRRVDSEVIVDRERGNIYSAFGLRSGGNTHGIDWIIINAQPLDMYKKNISNEIAEQLNEHQSMLESAVTKSLILTAVFVLIGTVLMALVARAVTRPLRAIETDMRAVANFDHDFIDRLLEEKSRYGRRKIREVSDICDSFMYMAVGLQSFSRYMDPHLVHTLVQKKRRAVLGMAKADVTVFFSDIAGFTTMAESLDPEVLMEVLGEYLQDMSSIVMRHGGVVGEFVGDEIMAWWNAPPLEYDGEHTVAALNAALEQQQRLTELREEWCEQGLPAVTARMGLVRGQVLAGNLGSAQRMKYGLVGDNVNLASRLEGLCKMYAVNCLVDDTVRSASGVAERFVLRPVDLVAVKGRSNATEIFELVAKKTNDLAPTSDAHSETQVEFSHDFAALQAMYRQGRFNETLAELKAFERRWPGDKPASILRSRCEALVKSPPGEGWSPMVQLTEK